MTKEILSVSDLTKRFGNIVALDRLTLSMSRGIFGLIGPNGAGKTTLIRVLLGLIRADAGSAKVLGLDVRTNSLKIRQKTRALHETPGFPGSPEVTHYLHHVSKLYDGRQGCDELLELIGLVNAKNRKIRDLSAGMRQRLGIALVLIGEPELVFLDEPTSNLDAIARVEILQMILQVHKEAGVSFFVSSHVLSELEKVCTDIAFMNEGQVIESGTFLDILRRHSANRYTIMLSDPHALLDGVQRIQEPLFIVGERNLEIFE